MESITKFSDLNSLVLQITPESQAGDIGVGHERAPRIAAYIYIPKDNNHNCIFCPLNYFQNSASIAEKWILDDNGNKFNLEFTGNLDKVIITEIKNRSEHEINISVDYNKRLLKYFKLDTYHNQTTFKGFDCYAFISFIADLEYFPEEPQFNYIKKEPNIGDFIVLANTDSLPDSIKHWALCLGSNYYLSKFGKSGEDAESLLNITDLDAMKKLYNSPCVFVANPETNAQKWNSYIAR